MHPSLCISGYTSGGVVVLRAAGAIRLLLPLALLVLPPFLLRCPLPLAKHPLLPPLVLFLPAPAVIGPRPGWPARGGQAAGALASRGQQGCHIGAQVGQLWVRATCPGAGGGGGKAPPVSQPPSQKVASEGVLQPWAARERGQCRCPPSAGWLGCSGAQRQQLARVCRGRGLPGPAGAEQG
jgi:hypothetical protein